MGHTQECKYTSLMPFVSVDCEWGEFVPGDCSVTCGNGTETMSRTILKEAMFGGNPCEGETSVVKSCFIADCPPGNTNLAILRLFIETSINAYLVYPFNSLRGLPLRSLVLANRMHNKQRK